METTLSGRIYSDYIKEVEQSGILTKKVRKRFADGDKSLKACLYRSRCRAVREFRLCHKDLVTLFDRMVEIEFAMGEDDSILSKKYSTYQTEWRAIFERFDLLLATIFEYAAANLIASFDKKIRRIDNFTICLFGRTKAGKSTTMEALTEGDGSTIGKGRQNTTRDAKEYKWRELLVVDTPGIDAMDEAHKLESMALSYADAADLIVFLLPHQIEEGDFEKFSRFYKQKKPILFLLNIKKEIGAPGSDEYRMFLKHTEDVFEEEKIAGYKKRIQHFMLDKLDVKKDLIPVIPVHSASAFMALHESDEAVAKLLRKVSNFDSLELQLVKEVEQHGELYRIKNPHETVVLFANNIVDEFKSFKEFLLIERDVFQKNIVKFSEVKAKILEKKNEIIREKIESYFNSKKKTVSGLVDELFSEKNESKRANLGNRFLSEEQINGRVRSVQKEIEKIVKSEIAAFFAAFWKELKDTQQESDQVFLFEKINSDLVDIDGTKLYANRMDNLALASGVLLSIGTAVVVTDGFILGAAGTLFALGSETIWNRLGWGLFAVSLIAGIGGLVLKNKHKEKTIRAKRDAVAKIRRDLDKTRDRISNRVDNWVSSLLNDIEQNHIGVMKAYVEHSDKYIAKCNALSEDFEKLCSRSLKQKYRAMLRCLLPGATLKLRRVVNGDGGVQLVVSGDKIKKKRSVERVLCRVEETPVKILEGSK